MEQVMVVGRAPYQYRASASSSLRMHLMVLIYSKDPAWQPEWQVDPYFLLLKLIRSCDADVDPMRLEWLEQQMIAWRGDCV